MKAKDLKVGDLVRTSLGNHALGIYLGPYTSINQKTGEPYACAEVWWLETNHISTAAFCVIDSVREAA